MINPTNLSKYVINKPSAMRRFVTSLDKSGAILPVLLLEGTVTGGRTYQAYKRDGFVEARERITEESLGAIFWLFGATMFGKLFDFVGRKFLRIPEQMPAVGVDIMRTPFKNYLRDMAGKLKVSPEYLAKFSVGKTFVSLVTACLFIGYVVPKMNQAITRSFYGKAKKNTQNDEAKQNTADNKVTLKDARAGFSAKGVSINAVENFKSNMGKNNSFKPSFKASADSLLRIVQNFEENAVWKLLGTDVGTVSGRTLNARNNDERVEIMFRDISSIYFYCFSMPHIVAFMNKRDAMGGLNTKLNPMTARETHNYLIKQMEKAGMSEKVSLSTFKDFALGKEYDEKLMANFFETRQKPAPKKILFGLFKREQELPLRKIELAEFEKIVDRVIEPEQRAKIKDVARRMSTMMQPESEGVKYLMESQVEDILRGGVARQPEFMSEAINNIFEESNTFTNFFRKLVGKPPVKPEKPLTDPYRYISQSSIEERRQQILDYVEAIVKDAKGTGEVTAERMLQLNKRNMRRNGLFMGLAMGVSALFLSTIIPKIQYYITYLRTGKNSFPGTEELNK